MKIIPQDRPQSLFHVSCIESIDFGDVIESCKTDSPPTGASVTFIGSEKAFAKFSQNLLGIPLKIRFCPTLDLLLRSGLYQESNLFIVPQAIPVARAEDIENVLSRRCLSEIKVINWDEESTDDLIESVEQAMLELELSSAKERVTERILDHSREWTQEHDELGSREEDFLNTSNAGLLDESQFKDFIRLKLEQHLDSSPEEILSKAIEAIRK
ncbi:MAG TPA: hypothetical protein DCG39_07750 [Opitutae bacterium]|nr:hypothetical protein [Opitutae bacterium]